MTGDVVVPAEAVEALCRSLFEPMWSSTPEHHPVKERMRERGEAALTAAAPHMTREAEERGRREVVEAVDIAIHNFAFGRLGPDDTFGGAVLAALAPFRDRAAAERGGR